MNRERLSETDSSTGRALCDQHFLFLPPRLPLLESAAPHPYPTGAALLQEGAFCSVGQSPTVYFEWVPQSTARRHRRRSARAPGADESGSGRGQRDLHPARHLAFVGKVSRLMMCGVWSFTFSARSMTSCGLTRWEGMSTFWPLTRKWPCTTNWRACPAGTGQPGTAIDHVVQPGLQDLEQVVTGLALQPVGLLVVAAELLPQARHKRSAFCFSRSCKGYSDSLVRPLRARRVGRGVAQTPCLRRLDQHPSRRDFLVMGPV